jgi:[acyl-carrier-protein] S-malonyltransferase
MTRSCHTARVADPVTVLAFPGQGSLQPGVGAPWREHAAFAEVGAVGEAAGIDVAGLLLDAPEDVLVSTENAQLATFALSLAILSATGLDARGSLSLGHSLGEYTALVAAGVVDRDAGARLVAARGAAMRRAADARAGGLVAMIGGDAALADAACLAIPGLAVANLNGPGQVVLGGPDDALEALAARAKELGFRRAIPLKVGGAFHTPLMAPAADDLAPALERTTFARGRMPVVANVDGVAHDDPADWPSLLLRQLTSPVRFQACVEALPAEAIVVECGAGGVLKGLISRIRDDVAVVSVGVPDDLASLEAVA